MSAKKGHGTAQSSRTVRLDKGDKEESEVTQEAQAGMGGGGKE